MTSPGKTNGTTTTHGRFDDGARASPSPVNVILRQKHTGTKGEEVDRKHD